MDEEQIRETLQEDFVSGIDDRSGDADYFEPSEHETNTDESSPLSPMWKSIV